jgi:hypothetical protein
VTTLVEFLTARLDDDELMADRSIQVGDRGAALISFASPAAPQVMLLHPARVLAEVAAKRAIVEMARYLQGIADSWTLERLKTDARSPLSDWARRDAYTEACAHLAAVYDDHPDYSETWRL